MFNDNNIDKIQFVASKTSFRKLHGNIYISDDQLNILEKYNIDVLKYSNVKELIYDIETYLNSCMDNLDDLEWVSETLSEYNYYNDVNK